MKTILIIDDEEGVIRYYRKLLESEGYHVLVGTDASKGTMALIKADEVDLILLDIRMPEINGAYMWEIIQEYNPLVKILVFSVHSLDEQEKQIPYATDYFDKSQSVELLLSKIAQLLNKTPCPSNSFIYQNAV